MSDIVERLRSMEVFFMESAGISPVAYEAAAAITALRARVEKLEGALVVWQNAYKTGRNEPLVQAYEHSTSLRAALGEHHE